MACIHHIMMIANDTAFVYNLRREILERFAEEDYRVTLVAENLGFREELEKNGCRLIELPTERRGTNPLADIRLLGKYLAILRKERPDIVFTNNIKPNVYAGIACQLLKIQYVPNICGLGTPVEHPGKMQKLTTSLYKIGVSKAETIFFQNEENLQFFRSRGMIGRRSKAVLLPGSGVNLQTHPLLPYPDGEEIHFLFAARIMKEKGIDLFLAAAERFHSEHVIFDICGACDDAAYQKILEDAQAKGVIRYHGLQKSVTPFYEKCSCFLYPSYYPEGMSNVLLEAAACGRPVIAADRSGCRETVEDGVSGYLVPINNEAAVIEAVGKFLSLTWDQRENMGLAGRQKVEREFDRKIVVWFYRRMTESAKGIGEANNASI